jgi:hypothetical protein
MERNLDLREATASHASTPILLSLEEPYERLARQQRLNDNALPILGQGPKIKKIPIFKGKEIREYYNFKLRLCIVF